MARVRWIAAVALTLVSSACSYHNASLSFRDLEQSGIYIAVNPTLPPEARPFGEVEITSRWFYFLSCDSAAQRAVTQLRQAALERGGNIVTNVRFRGRNEWTTNPQCRRNLNYAWLVLPMFLPVPQSVNIRGEAVYDPSVASQAAQQ